MTAMLTQIQRSPQGWVGTQVARSLRLWLLDVTELQDFHSSSLIGIYSQLNARVPPHPDA